MRSSLPLVILLLFGVSYNSNAQITLGSSPYIEDFNSITTGPPPGFTVRTGASATSLGTAVSTLTKASWATTSGQFTNYASATGLTSATSATDQSNATNRALGVRQTGAFGDPGAAFTLQLASTAGKTGFKLEFLLQSLDAASPRVTTWKVEYGLGANPTTFSSPATVTGDLVIGNSTFENNTLTVDFGNLLDNKTDIVTLRIVTLTATTGSGSRPSSAIDDFKLSWTDGVSTAPAIILNNGNPVSLTFPSTPVNTTSPSVTYTVRGENLTQPIDIASTAPFQIAAGAAGPFGNALTIPIAEAATDKTIYVRYAPTTTESSTGSISHTSNGATTRTISLAAQSFDPSNLLFNFNSCTVSGTPGSGFLSYSVTGSQVWACSNFGNNGTRGVDVNGFSGGALDNEDWLISPPLNVSSIPIPFLSFYSRGEFTGPSLQLLISTDYSGAGDPRTATWTNLNAPFPPLSNTWTLTDSIDLNAYKSTARFFVAFKYVSSPAAGAARWTLDDVRVYDATFHLSATPTVLDFAETPAGSSSPGVPVRFKALGYGDITITAPPSFQLSTDNSSFAPSVNLSAPAAAAGPNVYVRFAPASKQLKISGKIKATATGIDSNLVTVSGSSYPKAETVDIGAYNLSFFGSNSTNNPTTGKIDTQINNIAIVFQKLNLDIVGVEEVSSDDAMARLVAKLPGYSYVLSPRWSYSFNPPDPGFPPQKTGFVYNASVATLINTRVMFESLYDSARANETGVIRNYPTGTGSSFWASGRLPFMATFDVTVNGITKRLRVIDIHAKSADDLESYQRRAYDARVLKDTLDAYYANDNIIIVGDYNDRLFGSITAGQTSPYLPFVNDAAGYRGLTYPLDSAGRVSFITGTGLIDQIIVSNELAAVSIPGSTDIEDPRSYISGYNANTASDHLPIFTRFDLAQAQSPLPVQLLNFEGRLYGAQVVLNWTTTQEKNNLQFVIERSVDSRTFTAIASLPGVGSTSASTAYQYIDKNPLAGDNYYRLKQVDIDGTSSYSNVIRVSVKALQKRSLELYPNPVHSILQLSLKSASGSYAGIVTSPSGQLYIQERGDITDLNKKLNAKLDSLKPGVYILQLRSPSELHSLQFVKQ